MVTMPEHFAVPLQWFMGRSSGTLAGVVRRTSMKHLLDVTLAGLLTLTAGCATDGSRADGPKVFGEQPESCPATALSNGPDGDQNAEEHSGCFMTGFEVGRPVVWDVVAPTVRAIPSLSGMSSMARS